MEAYSDPQMIINGPKVCSFLYIIYIHVCKLFIHMYIYIYIFIRTYAYIIIYIYELPIGTGDSAKSIWVFAGVADSGSGVAHRWWSFVAAMGVWHDISSSEDEEEEKLSIPMRIFQLFWYHSPMIPWWIQTPCAGLHDDSGAGELHLLWRPLSAIGRTFG